MADEKSLAVDAKLIRTLTALLDENRLTEIEYEAGGRRIRIARAAAVAPPVGAVAAPAPAAALSVAPAEAPGTVKAPMVGTVYLAPAPDAAPFVKLGDTMREGQTLLIIEAMKVMNHIAAPRAGRVASILVADGAPVEYGQPLIVIE
jgi:acetyl-CoA carboxylase biotin carboxyl carrier protein